MKFHDLGNVCRERSRGWTVRNAMRQKATRIVLGSGGAKMRTGARTTTGIVIQEMLR